MLYTVWNQQQIISIFSGLFDVLKISQRKIAQEMVTFFDFNLFMVI